MDMVLLTMYVHITTCFMCVIFDEMHFNSDSASYTGSLHGTPHHSDAYYGPHHGGGPEENTLKIPARSGKPE